MGKFLNSIWGSWLKVFAVAVLVKFSDLGGNIFALDAESLKHLVNTGVISLIPVIINFLNPQHKTYGIGKE